MASTDTASETAAGTDLQEAARRHLWMHFTRMGSYDSVNHVPDHHQGRRLLRVRRARQALSRRALGAVLRQRRPRAHRAWRGLGAPGLGARLLHHLELRPSARDRARRADRLPDAGRPEPRVLHQQRVRGGRVGDQARARLPPADRQPAQDQVPQPRDRLSRHYARRPAGDRDHRTCGRTSNRSSPAASRRRTRTATTGRRAATRSGPPTRSRRRSSSRGRRRSPRSSSSRCRTPAAASLRRTATSSGFGRSATATTSCWSPTR